MVCQSWFAILMLSFCLCFIHMNISGASKVEQSTVGLHSEINEENRKSQILTNAHTPYNDITRRLLGGGGRGGGGGGGSGRSFSGRSSRGGGSFRFAGGGHNSNRSSVRASSSLHVIIGLLCYLCIHHFSFLNLEFA